MPLGSQRAVLTAQPTPGTANFTLPGTYSWTVPARVRLVTVDIASAGGGNAPTTVHVGGPGGRMQARVPVTPGETLTVTVGAAGANGSGGSAGAGGNGLAAGGAGGATAPCGGGGGLSAIQRGSTLLLAPGAGGGSGNVTNGGNGVGLGTVGTTAVSGGGRAGGTATTSSGSGGGGAGSVGGAAGTSNNGGSGGSGYNDPSCGVFLAASGYRVGDGSVSITWV